MPSWCGQTVQAGRWSGRPASGPGNGPVGDDKELLSGPNEAELTPGQLFDGRGVVTQAIGLEREVSVLSPEPCDRLDELLILASDPDGLEESPLAGNGVGQEDGGCQEQQESRQTAPDRGRLVAVTDFLCAAPYGGAQGQGPLDPGRPSCGG